MRRVFLIGLGIGIILFWIYELDLESMILGIYVLIMIMTSGEKIPPLPVEMVLFFYLTSILVLLSSLYSVTATTRLKKVNNHLDMLLCGMMTGILLKWFAGLGETELLTGVALFLLGYPLQVYKIHLKPFPAGRLFMLSATSIAILRLTDGLYADGKWWMALAGFTIASLGALTELNCVRPIGAMTFQELLLRFLRFLKLVPELPKKPEPYVPPPAQEPEPALPTATQIALTPAPETKEKETTETTKRQKRKQKKRVSRKRGRAKKAETAPAK